MKEYTFKITVETISMGIEANNDDEAKQKLKDIFMEDNNIELMDDEIEILESREVE
jgi:hypothetical protein